MSSFHLYVLGSFKPDEALVTLAEFEGSRAVERVAVKSSNVEALTELTSALRVFIEAGAPPFDNRDLELLGGKLFDFIITGDVRRVLDTARGGRESGLLPMELFLEDDILAGWPWEYMFDDKANSFLCQEFHPISRGIYTIIPRRKPRAIEGKIKLALLLGVRSGDRHTTPDEEVRWIRNVFDQDLKDAVEIKPMQGATYTELEDFLVANKFHILHFFGHARFDARTQSGYLRFDSADGKSFRLTARQFATMVMQHQNDTRLVFLNACESGRTSAETDPARSSIAAALVELGVPAVVATQFSIADVSAHHLSSKIYKALAKGAPLIDAMTRGRRAMQFAEESQSFDWGIPVLYASDPSIEVFPAAVPATPLVEVAAQTVNVATTRTAKSRPKKLKVALIDVDAKSGFLPQLVEQANAAQNYYQFQVDYLPLPSGAVLTKLGRHRFNPPVLMLERIDQPFKDAPTRLNVDRVSCITACMIGGREKRKMYYDLFASSIDSNKYVFAVSATGVREYAAEAAMEFSKAILFLVLAELVRSDERWHIDYHPETRACLFDFCDDRHDIVKGLRKSRFDHKPCRKKITDDRLLTAIDALLAL
ncbi:MAG TPA: CHAT domain-containing protein [Thermoanaerobaculia bacterium]|nr:CHAT domain-containing protein [Thermoanaerobaculia bacterium]